MQAIPVPVELGIPLPGKYNYADLKRSVDAACATAKFLEEHGAEYPEPSRADKERAAALVAASAANQKQKQNPIGKERTQAVKYAKSLLDEYGHRVVESSQQIRHHVTTKLIHESENADPKVRLKALELLGKISDVGLFSEKTEVTVTHQTSDELKDKLRAKLEKLINPATSASLESTKANTHMLEATIKANDPDLDFSDVTLDGEYEEVPNKDG